MLPIPPTWQGPHAGPVKPELARVTVVLVRIAEQLSGPQGYGNVARALAGHPRLHSLVHSAPMKGQQHVSTVIGDTLDCMFKQRVREAQRRGELPPDLRVAAARGTGPDVVWERELAAWDLTTAEAGRNHVERDTLRRPNYLHYYWVLGY